MDNDPRCCGSGTCIIDAEGRCWCGQRWDGERMCHEPAVRPAAQASDAAPTPQNPTAGHDAGPAA